MRLGLRAAGGRIGRALALLVLLAGTVARADEPGSPYRAWQNGPPKDPGYFPVAVWLQAPRNAARYKDLGINLYVALWQGPTAAQLKDLKDAGMAVICHQNQAGLTDPNREVIVGWMHGDEPDNAQPLPGGKGYGPPILPRKIVDDYERLKKTDPTRPVLLNLGQGVAWDGWHGRGVRSNKPEDYPQYVQGCDIASFDIYPANHDRPAVTRQLWYVGRGVERLRGWAGEKRLVWNCIECTPISDPTRKPTPKDVRAEVWMSLVHGSKGLIYFVHVFKPKFIEAGLLADAEMAAAVKGINRQIHELAPVLNSPTVTEGVKLGSSDAETPVAGMVKRHGGATYVFAVALRDRPATGTFAVAGMKGDRAEVIGEGRTVPVQDGRFEDRFEGYGVHLYRIAAVPNQ